MTKRTTLLDSFDWDAQDRLTWLAWDMQIGERSDWVGPVYNHTVSMTCGAFSDKRNLLAKWVDQLAVLLVDLQVESMLPGVKTDSLGDNWAQHHTWTWREGDSAA